MRVTRRMPSARFISSTVASSKNRSPPRRIDVMGRLKGGPHFCRRMLQDIRYAIRSLMRRPLVTGVAVLSLALGIGVNTAIFSVFDRLLLGRLPVQAPGDLVVLSSPGPRPGWNSSGDGGDE